MSDEMTAKDIGEILDEVTTKVPKLLTSLMSVLYSAEAGQKMGKAVGNFYKELIDSGIPSEVALEMAKDYVGTLKGMTDSLNRNG